MSGSARDRARSLELIIRAAAAEERLLARRLDSIAESHRRARDDVRKAARQEDGSSER